MKKKIILITIFVLIIFILGYLIYSLFFKSSLIYEQPSTQKSEENYGTGLPTANIGTNENIGNSENENLSTDSETTNQNSTEESQTITSLTDSPSLDPTLSDNGKTIQYYNSSDGKFYIVNEDGEIDVLSDKNFYNVESVEWSPDTNKAIIEYPDGANILYDFETETQVTLPEHWEDFDFSPRGDQIVLKSIGLDVENRWLAISNDDGSNITAIESIGANTDTVYTSWSANNQVIAMYTKGVDFNRQEVYFVGLNDENFKSTVIEGRGFEYEWTPEGDRLLYSVYSTDSDLNPELWIVDAQGDDIGSNRTKLNIQTWAEKCTFASNTTIYCAVPDELEAGSGIFKELAEESSDSLYKINTQTGLKQLVLDPDDDYTMSNLIVSDDGDTLYFTDGSSERIYKVELD